ncbi:MAG: peroxiredoxin [Planctomycetes bacterium]|nr:peroxiredoxin [Planctomycetota bacterium]
MSIEIGSKAPAFALKDDAGATVKLSEFAGRWVVLYFYPRADTPGCTKEACEFTAAIRAFEGMDADVVGVSPDASPALAKFRAKYGLKVRLLGDPGKETLAAYDAWGTKKLYGKEVVGVKRSTVIVDPNGRVAHHWKSVKAAGHAAFVQAKLTELRAGK